MRRFYSLFSKGQAVPDQLTWSHYIKLLKLRDMESINYYIEIATKFNLSYRELHQKIKNNEYERLPKETKLKLINKEENTIEEFIKNPILIKNKYNYTEISEKILKS